MLLPESKLRNRRKVNYKIPCVGGVSFGYTWDKQQSEDILCSVLVLVALGCFLNQKSIFLLLFSNFKL